MKSKIKADKRWSMAIPLAILFVVLTIITTAGTASAQWATNGNNINNTNTGNVGVGTSSPVNKLDVAPAAADGIRIRGTGPDTNTSDVVITNRAISVTTGGFTFPNTYTAMFGNASGGTAGDSGGVLMTVAHTLDNNTNSLLTLYNRNQFGFEQHGYFLRATGNATSDKFWLNASGNAFFAGSIGVGTQTPSTKLHVVGDVTVTGNIAARFQDVAEWVPTRQKLVPGTVVVLDAERGSDVVASFQAYDTKVAGVISVKPGLALGESGEDKVLVATTGRVRVKVDATRAPIRVGDLLVTSDTTGYAMKSEPIVINGRSIHSPGTLIGKALAPLDKGTGEIMVLLSLQ